RRAASAAWECPACLVDVDGATVAVACGYPTDDPEALGDWAARLALFLSKRGIKRAILGGPEPACAEAREALALIGIDVVRQLDAPPRGLLGRIFG
ncbi:MAG: hypothetical protein KC657_20200, partial [Myxococcales bacterium]|nr:hypothetical protein [Myxococcales bacterium]